MIGGAGFIDVKPMPIIVCTNVVKEEAEKPESVGIKALVLIKHVNSINKTMFYLRTLF